MPFALFAEAQSPEARLHAPTLHIAFCAEQSLVIAAVEHTPAAQVPAGVQPLPPQAPVSAVSVQLPVVLLQVGAE